MIHTFTVKAERKPREELFPQVPLPLMVIQQLRQQPVDSVQAAEAEAGATAAAAAAAVGTAAAAAIYKAAAAVPVI